MLSNTTISNVTSEKYVAQYIASWLYSLTIAMLQYYKENLKKEKKEK